MNTLTQTVTPLVERGDERGKLVAIEPSNIGFDIKRIFYIYSTDTLSRGKHAHHLANQALVCLSGRCNVHLTDGITLTTYNMNSTTKVLIQPAGVWGEMSDFSKDCILLVLSDRLYEPEDYIHDFDEFKKIKGL